MASRNVQAEEPIEDTEEEAGIDLAKILLIVGFFTNSARRHPRIATGIGLGVFLVAVALAMFLPRSYPADLRILAQRNVVLPTVETSGGSLPQQEPTKGVVDEVMRRDRIIGLIKELDLVNRWDETRPPALRLKDQVVRVLHGPPSDAEKMRALVGIVEARLIVSTDQDSITFQAEWPTAQVAYDLVNTAYADFLDNRYQTEVSMFSERLKILESRAQLSAQEVDAAIAELTKLEQERRQGGGLAPPAAAEAPKADGAAPAGSAAPSAPSAPVVRVRALPPGASAPTRSASDDDAQALEAVRAQVRDLEAEHRRRLADAEAQLSDAQATLGPLHPMVVALKQKVEALSEPSSKLAELQAQEKKLVERLAANIPPPAAGSAGAGEGGGRVVAGGIRTSTLMPALAMSSDLRDLLTRDDPPTAYARAKLQSASQQYNETLGRVQLAKVELDVARTSFKHTYSVARPAELAKRPRKPNVLLLVLAGILGGAVLAFLTPGLRDLAAGRFLEAWQVESALGIPVLGELPPAPPEPPTG